MVTRNRFFFHTRIVEPQGQPWELICVYGDASHASNRDIWQELTEIVTNNSNVCIIGDFNAIANESDKFGGNPNLNSNSRGFREFLFDAGLMDLGFKGPAFTWTNRQHTSSIIFE